MGAKTIKKNRNQKKFPIQIHYYFKEGLQDYYNKFYSGKIEKPDFSDKCPICGGRDCAGYHGYYLRTAICPGIGFNVTDFPVMRFKCKADGKSKKNNHVTFSLLPIELVPYRQLSLKFMILALWLRLNNDFSLTHAMDIIENINELADIGEFLCINNQISWEKIVKTAFKLFLSSSIYIRYKIQFTEKGNDNKKELLQFIEFARTHHLKVGCNKIRGPDALALEYYKSTNTFLFGTASQHRK